MKHIVRLVKKMKTTICVNVREEFAVNLDHSIWQKKCSGTGLIELLCVPQDELATCYNQQFVIVEFCLLVHKFNGIHCMGVSDRAMSSFIHHRGLSRMVVAPSVFDMMFFIRQLIVWLIRCCLHVYELFLLPYLFFCLKRVCFTCAHMHS